jgi:isopentenyl diphosphate isomerase/L-lactate dehydrogenase-like FMN-dependent dehydrogenase
VERVLDILRGELALTMRQCGTTSIRDISAGSVSRV